MSLLIKYTILGSGDILVTMSFVMKTFGKNLDSYKYIVAIVKEKSADYPLLNCPKTHVICFIC